MRGRFASYRFRRRFAWITVLVAAASGVVVASVLLGNTAKPPPEHLTNRPAQVVRGFRMVG